MVEEKLCEFIRGDKVVSTEECPYAARGGKYHVCRVINEGLMELYVDEHSDPFFVNRMFKGKPCYFKNASEVVEEPKKVDFAERMKVARAKKKGKKE